MRRVFLDANILFSAAYRAEAGLRRLWELPEAVLLTSAYAAEEARRNLDLPEQRLRLDALLDRTLVVPESAIPLPADLGLAQKDQPILKAAISAGATHLVTGDVQDFGRFFGRRVLGILIVPPADLIAEGRIRR
jgi:predicted nucleic acid-binding protein